MAERFGQRPSDLWGIADLHIALDFDRLCNLRLTLHEAEIRKLEAEAMKGETNTTPSLFKSNETGAFS
jgi:hypothetical protein